MSGRALPPRATVAVVGVAALVAASTLVGAVAPAGALTAYTVTSTVDGAPGSLRAVLDQANADADDSVIELPAGAVLDLDLCPALAADDDANADGDLDSTDGAHDLTIEGNGATIRQTCTGSRVFDATNAGSTVTFREVTITGGNVTSGLPNGGGIRVVGPGSLSVVLSTVVGNSAANVGGGIAATDIGVDTVQVFVADSTISGNSAGRSSGGGLFTLGDNLIVNSTISGNSANESAALVGDTQLIYTTIYGNIARTDAAFLGVQLDIGTLTSFASVIAGGVGAGPECITSTTNSGGWNLIDDDSCDLTEATDLTSTDPLLGPLADNGGPTLTHLPQPGSPLVDHVPAGSCNPTYVADQRNVARPQGTGCDTGSVEVRQDVPPTSTTSTTAPATSAPPATVAPSAVVAQPRFTG